MEELDFNSLFEASSGDYAGGVLERLFGGIIPFLKGEAASPGTNWLSEMFTIFNMVGFIGVMIISSYTIYTVIFDTAADGKTFGQNADTKYTLMRILGGAIAFIPVTGGYSVAQVVLLWLMIQASSLADVVWARTAEASLEGQSLLSPSGITNLADIPIQRQFAEAYDALVLGHICAYNANDIRFTLENSDASRRNGTGAMILQSSITTEERARTNWVGAATGEVDRTRTHQMFFTEPDGAEAYGRRDNFCGGVAHSITITSGGAGDDGIATSFRDAVINVQRNARFDTYQAVMGTLSGRAADVAWRVFNQNERDVQVLEDLSRAAVTEATTAYLSGVRSSNVIPDAQSDALNAALLDRATEQGWMFAPSWQRGIAMSASHADAIADDFSIESDRRFAITDYLSRNERRSDIGRSMLAMAEDDRATWELMGSTISRLGDPEEADNYRPLDGGGEIELDAIGSRIYQYLLGLLSVTGGAEEDSAVVTDPMVDVTKYGQGLMKIGFFTGAAAYLADGGAWFLSRGAVDIDGITGPIKVIAWGFVAIGFVVSFLIPLIPFAYFYSAVISWFLLILEAFFAVPLAVLTLFAPAREGTLIGSWNKILLSIFGIVLRPFFTIIGMVISMIVISFALSYLYDMFYGMVQFLTPNGAWGLLGMFGFLFVFMLLTLYTVMIGASLITELGDGAMNWLGIGLSSLSQRMDVGRAATDGMQITGRVAAPVGQMTKATTAIGAQAGSGAKALGARGVRAIGKMTGGKG